MGSGSWSVDSYTSTNTVRAAAGKSAFDYSTTTMSSTPRDKIKPHPDMDPMGVKYRESRDSDEHPNSVAIAVLFDVTGSMAQIPEELQKRLPALLELLQYKHYVDDAQILFGCFGDATCDPAPLQVGQFESDNRMDQNLENMVLTKGGGGQNTESYELALYFMARHTAIDCFEKRGKKGYLFVIGDETAYPAVKPNEVRAHIGDDLSEPIYTPALIKEVQEKYELFFIVPGGHNNNANYWKDLLGQNCLMVPDLSTVAETIALQIGISEDTIKLDEGLKHLEEHGVDASTIASVSTALSTA